MGSVDERADGAARWVSTLGRLESAAQFTLEFFGSSGQLTNRASWATLSAPPSSVADLEELNSGPVS